MQKITPSDSQGFVKDESDNIQDARVSNTQKKQSSATHKKDSLSPKKAVKSTKGTKDGLADKLRRSRKKRKAIRKHKREVRIQAREAWKKSGVGWRVLPRTLLGIVVSLMLFATGAGVSGAVLFAYYEARVTESENKIAEFATDLDRRVADGVSTLEVVSENAESRLSGVLGPFEDLLQNPDGLPGIVGETSSAIALVETSNEEGKPEFGTATAVGAVGGETIFVTAFNVVSANSAEPAPPITLRKGSETIPASLVGWDVDLGLAVLVATTNSFSLGVFAPLDKLGILTGSPVFSISALNTAVVPGAVAVVTSDGFRHSGPADSDFRGGPILNGDGEIVGFVNNSYQPSGIPGGNVPWSPTVVQLCKVLLECEDEQITAQ